MPRSRSNQSYKTSRRWRAAEARTALEALARSGLSIRAFAAREGLDPERLYRWRRRLEGPSARAEAPPTFVEVVGRPAGVVEVVLGSGRVLRVSETIGTDALARIVRVLEELPRC